jgi:hypothetical protein
MWKGKKDVGSWQKKLADRLDDEVKGDPAYQIKWLVLHLREYLERWLGFATMDSLSVAATLSNDVFYVVLAAANLIEEKIVQLDYAISFPREEWQHFSNALQWIQKTPERSELALITTTFESFCKNVPKEVIDLDNAS